MDLAFRPPPLLWVGLRPPRLTSSPLYYRLYHNKEIGMYKKPLPSAERLHHLLSYDPDTGDLRWKNPTHHRCAKGVIDPIGTQHGYKVVRVDGVTYLQHRIIWVMQTGSPPPDALHIDHIDECPGNNRWSNLRLLDNSTNVSRSSKHKREPIVCKSYNESWQVWKGREYVGRFVDEAAARKADPSSIVDRRRSDAPIVRAKRAKSKANWEARVRINGVRHHIGTYPTREAALAAAIPRHLLTD